METIRILFLLYIAASVPTTYTAYCIIVQNNKIKFVIYKYWNLVSLEIFYKINCAYSKNEMMGLIPLNENSIIQ